MATATDFCVKFAQAYQECRDYFTDVALWEKVWTTHYWSNFVLWNPVAPQPKPLMRVVAEKLELVWWDREPFHFDGVMVPPDHQRIGNYPLPLLVAVEHENNIRTFREEIVKLAHMICPLKVGITYMPTVRVPPDAKEVLDCQKQIEHLVEVIILNRSKYIKEDPKTEYLYILGVESRIRELQWCALSFSADAGVTSGVWHEI